LVGFVRSLSATWRRFLLRFALVFIALAIAWSWVLAPVYAQFLAMLGRPVIPAIENTAGTTYWVEGATVYTKRSFVDPTAPRPIEFKIEIWRGYSSYDLILLTALILATPGWSLRQRGRLVGLGLLLITATEFAFFLSTIEYLQVRPVPGLSGSLLYPAGFTRPKQVVFTWIYYFFQTMGRGLFPLLIYWGMIGFTWGQSDAGERKQSEAAEAGRNAPCPCGSGKKYKHCCGKA
jgi:hypothetical protein